MLKVYSLDLRSLSPELKADVLDKIEKAAFLVEQRWGKNGVEELRVYWDLESDFSKSPLVPKDCPCCQIS